jgi:hypothetical protein
MSRKGKKQVHLFLSDNDVAVLVDMEDRFGLNRSEIIRRLVRAAHGHGPMLTAEDSQTIIQLSHQLRRLGANLYNLLCALRDGFAVSDEEGAELWHGLYQHLLMVDEEINKMAMSHGLRLRRSARLEDYRADLEETNTEITSAVTTSGHED